MGQALRQTILEHREYDLREIKLDDKAGKFSGYGAMFDNVDSYGDVIEKGAFKNTLQEWNDRGKFPPMLLQHGGGFLGGADDMLPIGKWTSMVENSKGLKVEGELFAMGTERGQYIYEGLKSGVLDGLSIGFVAREVVYHDTKAKSDALRSILDVDLWEVSVVTFPANPKARIQAVKNLTVDDLRVLEDISRDEGFSRRDCIKVASVLKRFLQRDAAVPRHDPRDEDSSDAAIVDAIERLYR